MDLLNAAIAIGLSKRVAESQIGKLDPEQITALESQIKSGQLPLDFGTTFRTAVAESDRRQRGENKGVPDRSPTSRADKQPKSKN